MRIVVTLLGLGLALAVGLSPIPRTRRGRVARSLVLVLLVCFLAVPRRVSFLRSDLDEPIPSSEVEAVAVSLARGQGFCNAFGSDTGPTAHVAPLYPLLLAGLYRLTEGSDARTIRMVQGALTIAAATAALLLLPLAARSLGLSSPVGWAAAVFLAGLQPTEWSEVSGFHETAWVMLDLVLVTAALAALRRQGWRRGPVCLAGVLLGITALLSPVVLFAAGLQLLASLVSPTERRRALAAAGLMLGIAALIVLPWVVRNAVVFGRLIPLRSNFGLELAIGNNDATDGRTYFEGFGPMHPWTNPSERARVAAMGEDAYVCEKRSQSLRWIAAHPDRFAALTLHRAWLLFFSPPALRHGPGAPLESYAVIQGMLAAVALVGLGWLAWCRHPSAAPLAASVFGFCLPYLLTHVNLRYRLPLPLLLALPALALVLAGLRAVRLGGNRQPMGPPTRQADAEPLRKAA